ncbi:MarR family transcriptional regulator [Paraburkholderia sp. Ac-20342]|uniref:MarR family winged helix-turn-helix transcriptional regulator n=1 Tax=Paraburkholderia sp. Ac-20342 TaxID=2703889 RepID=UPI001981A628|nr:MarR family transcriptional regulator [Paraburkholderia sp. Ac-20342]MBN3846694.1 MarR family transcriptional regulator [Paraburkholderia sp. Ac-20342]
MTKPNPDKHAEGAMLTELYSRPGFMLRRAHQIAIDLFVQACLPVNITPSQYGVLYIVNTLGSLSQIGISRLIGLDRSTTALVVKLLTDRGLLTKTQSTEDARKIEIQLTNEGKKIFREAQKLAEYEMKTLLEPFTNKESEQFLHLLEKFVSYHNDTTRVSITGSSSSNN